MTQAWQESLTMIIQFTAKNYGPFKNKVYLRFASAKSEEGRKFSTVARNTPPLLSANTKRVRYGVLPVLGVWGPNDTGKSLLLQGLSNIRHLAQGAAVSVSAFEGQEDIPTTFELCFAVMGQVFDYEISFLDGDIIEEELREISERHNVVVFRRDSKSGAARFRKFFTKKTSEIHTAAADKSILATSAVLREVFSRVLPDYKLSREYVPGESARLPKGRGELLCSLGRDADFDTSTWARALSGDKRVNLSSGSREFLRISEHVVEALCVGGLAVVDDISGVLHPDVCKEIIKLFVSPESNSLGAQLVFSSHQASLMDTLRRDEVYLVEKTLAKHSHLYSVSDFKLKGVKPEVLTSCLYKYGRLGGTPFTGNMSLTRAASTDEITNSEVLDGRV